MLISRAWDRRSSLALGIFNQGDTIEVMGYDQDLYRFRIDWIEHYPVATAPVLKIVGRTSTESLTLITCSGTFDAAADAYDQRLVVRATRRS